MTLFSRTDRSMLGQWWWTVDRPMLAAFMVLVVLGVLMVTTASPPVAEHLGLGYYHFLKRHIIMLVPALIMLFGISFYVRIYAFLLTCSVAGALHLWQIFLACLSKFLCLWQVLCI